ncbi:M10 family metallopeptidase C-terminal domain-containing protein, partial [Pseudoruegeria sp. SK021]|uniref:M10 family metallopeptidase C-terminal domain-containing protein n=1 Tax=Pseudoruegeria sp. SK021 TaxID=1933035 RepID=UPI000A266655
MSEEDHTTEEDHSTHDEYDVHDMPIYTLETADGTLDPAFPSPQEAVNSADSGAIPDDTDVIALDWASTWGTSGAITFAFSTHADQYLSFFEINFGIEIPYSNYDEPDSLILANAQAQRVFRDAISKWGALIAVEITEEVPTTDTDILIAGSTEPSTAWAYAPGLQPLNGDIWINFDATKGSGSSLLFDKLVNDTQTYVGSYEYLVAMHEFGHSLGLKHPHQINSSNPALSLEFDSLEYTVMSYRSYIGDASAGSYSVEAWGYPQSMMILDIAQIQATYGANYATESGDTLYQFDTATGAMSINGVLVETPGANRVFRTIWDGGGTDTLDLSNYTTDLVINLTPGTGTDLDVGGLSQRSALGRDTYDLDGDGDKSEWVYASYHLYMSLLYEDNAASLIENAVGGSGNDVIIGNDANNLLQGGLGADTLTLGLGSDTVQGTLAELDGDTISDFATEDRILVEGSVLSLAMVAFDKVAGTVLIDADADADGSADAVVSVGFETPDTPMALTAYADFSVIGAAEDGVIGMTMSNDLFYSSSTEDLLVFGNDGNDTLSGGSGNDTLVGGNEADYLLGGDGDDVLIGGVGGDVFVGGAGADHFVIHLSDVQGGGLTDKIRDFDTSEDVLEFRQFNAQSMSELELYDYPNVGVVLRVDGYTMLVQEAVLGELTEANFLFSDEAYAVADTYETTEFILTSGADRWKTQDNNDATVYAGAGADLLESGGGNDFLYSGDDNDAIFGGAGDDYLDGGTGSDYLTGGAGADIFVFRASDVDNATGLTGDIVRDFTVGEDVIEMSGFGFTSIDDLQFFKFSNNTFVYINMEQTILLEGIPDA